MCGRYVAAKAVGDIQSFFDVDRVSEHLAGPSWNIAPTVQVNVVLDAPDKAAPENGVVRRLESARWGLVPSWAKDPSVGSRMFNARIEDAADKPSFKSAVVKRRAAIPASGYYEWHTAADGTKTPMYISPGETDENGDTALFAFAGLYEWWRNPAASADSPDKWLLSTTILTQDSDGPLAEIHSRMPVVLDRDALDLWLDPTTEGDRDLLDDVATSGAETIWSFQAHSVGREVGNVRNDGPGLIVPHA